MAVSLSSCATSAPNPPRPPLFQPIIEQKLCDENGECIIQSFCREYHYAEQTQEYLPFAKHDLKKCHGIFGVESSQIVKIKKYIRNLYSWIKNSCGANRGTSDH